MSGGISTGDLVTIQQLDKSHYLASYLRDQRANKNQYAAEGQAVVSMWSPSSADPGRLATVKSHPMASGGIGFDTPVLKPRAARRINRSQHEEGPKDDIALKEDSQSGASGTASPQSLESLTRKRTRSPKVSRDPTKKKQSRAPGGLPDEEKAARLVERRERKRSKRAMVQPPRLPPQSPKLANSRRKSSNWKSKSNKEKVPPGFALMYGLNATNVGVNRLTVCTCFPFVNFRKGLNHTTQLKPPISIGVFSKGKSSTKAQTHPKRVKAQKPNYFSEHAFLSKSIRPPDSAKSSHQISSVSGNGSDSDVPTVDKMKQRKTRDRSNKALSQEPRRSVTPSSSSSVRISVANGLSPRRPVKSIVWDIERDDADTLPTVSPCCKKSDLVEGTVIVDAHRFQTSGTGVNRRTKGSATKHSGIPTTAGSDDSSISLRPSDSASRIRHCEIREVTVSQYFTSQQPPSNNDHMEGNFTVNPLPQVAIGPAQLDFTEPTYWLEDLLMSPGFDVPATTQPNNLVTQAVESLQEEPRDMPSIDTSLDSRRFWASEKLAAPQVLSGYASLLEEFYEQVDDDCLLREGVTADTALPTNLEHDIPAFPQSVHSFAGAIPFEYFAAGDPINSFSEGESGSCVILETTDGYPWSMSVPFMSSPRPPSQDQVMDYCDQEISPQICSLADPQDDMRCASDITLDEGYNWFPESAPEYEMYSASQSLVSMPSTDLLAEPEAGSIYNQDGCPSEVSATDTSSLAPQRFCQGRALLLGLSKPGAPGVTHKEAMGMLPLSKAEKDVAKLLRGHWLPQKF